MILWNLTREWRVGKIKWNGGSLNRLKGKAGGCGRGNETNASRADLSFTQ